MTTPPRIRVVNSLVWIVCGAIVLIVRALIIQTASILLWEVLGGAMILYGAVRLIFAFSRREPQGSSAP